MEFMCRDAGRVNAHGVEIHIDLCDGLNRIAMEWHARSLADRDDLLDCKDYTRFVVRPHDRNKSRLIGYRIAKFSEIERPLSIHRDLNDLKPFFPQLLAQFARGRVFDG